jgi:N-acylneuraminate cytidylyltransferase
VRAEWLVQQGNLDMVYPGAAPRSFPERVELVVLDFDGVLTDNRVWVDGDGRELIAANRGDGWGIAKLSEIGIDVLILSTETNPVVTARAKKLKLHVEQGIGDKSSALKRILGDRKLNPQNVIYVGNDVNDLPCFPLVGYAFGVQDAHADVLRAADYVLASEGGHGAVREVCDMIQERIK